MSEHPYRGSLPFSEPPGHPDANRNWHSVGTEWVWQNYYHGLGYLMHSYSQVEATLNMTINGFVKAYFREPLTNNITSNEMQAYAMRSKKRDELLQAIVGTQRPAQAKETLKRILRVTGAETHVSERVDGILSHFSAIGAFRDLLAHNAPEHDKTNKSQIFIIRNTFTVNERKREVVFPFPAELLVRAAFDLAHMPDFLWEILNPSDEVDPAGAKYPTLWDRYGGWKCRPSELTPPHKSGGSTAASANEGPPVSHPA
jgi:hypothetical protein